MRCVWCGESYGLPVQGVDFGHTHNRNECSEIIRAKERERCAKIAEAHNPESHLLYDNDCTNEECGPLIAKRIRDEATVTAT